MVADFSRKSKDEITRKKIFIQIGCLFAFLLFVILVIADIKIYRDKQQMLAQIEGYEKQIENVKKSSEHLKEEINNANNRDYLEQMAYEQFDKHRPGEQEIIFVSAVGEARVESASKNSWMGWIGSVLDWFKGKQK